jgi:alpha-glucosidase
MSLSEWLKVKLATHVLQPLLNRRSPARPWRPLRGFRSYNWNETRTLCTVSFENGQIEISAPAPRVFKVLVLFKPALKTKTYDGEYFTYAVLPQRGLPLGLLEEGGRLSFTAAGEGGAPELVLDTATGLLEARSAGGSLFGPARCAAAGRWVSFAARPPEPRLYLGFGQKTGGLFKNGTSFVMWNTDFADMHENSDPLYQSCPLAVLLGEGGSAAGLFFDNPHYARFRAPRRGRPGRFRYRAARGPLAFYLLGGPELRDVVRQFAALSGRYRLPPLWALGHHHARWEKNESAERLRGIARGFRERSIPLDALHVDIGYLRGFRCFTWNAERFPDPDGFLRALREQRIQPVVITDPGLKKDDEWNVYREGKERGFFLTGPDGSIAHAPVWAGLSAFPDFGASAAARWWGDQFKIHTDRGIEGFWIDMNEPAAFTPRRTLADGVLHSVEPAEAGGTLRRRDHASLHNYYGFLMAKATAEGLERLLPGRRFFLFTRSSFAGIQRYASSWTGDIKSRWDHLRFTLPMVMNLGLSGQIMTGPDIGGFWGAPSPELFVRFLEAATFFPFHRNHTADGTPPQEIWAFGERIESICVRFIRLRYAFLLYLYTALRHGTVTGDPVCRPLLYDFPGDRGCLRHRVADTEYLCGGDLLVAPVLEKGRGERAVYFPTARAGAPRERATEWVCYWTHEIHGGGNDEAVSAPLDRLPLFVRRGAVLPLLQSEPGAFTSSGQLYDQTLCLDVFPAPAFGGSLYLDDGETPAYAAGRYSLVSISGRETKDGLSAAIEQTAGSVPAPFGRFRSVLLRLARFGKKDAPGRVTVNGRELPRETAGTEDDWIVIGLPVDRLPVNIEIRTGEGA